MTNTRRPDLPGAVIQPTAYTTLPDLVAVLTAAREARGLSQRDLANLIGVTQSTLSAWETPNPRKRVEPSAGRLLGWANALGIDLHPAAGEAADAYRRGWADCVKAFAGLPSASAILAGLPDRGHAVMAAAETELGPDAAAAHVILRAADLATRSDPNGAT